MSSAIIQSVTQNSNNKNNNNNNNNNYTDIQQHNIINSKCPCAKQHPNRKCLKHCLVMFGRSFYIAYGLRAGLSLALHIIKILRSKQPTDILNIDKLFSANGLPVEAVRVGLLFGGFSGIYHGVQCLLARLQQQHNNKHILISGSVAGLISIYSIKDVSSRRTLALYMFARCLQTWYNNQKKNKKFHFWGSNWEHGDSLLFVLSCVRITLS